MGNYNRKLRKSRKGVSDIIGNILILGITVTLFSSIMMFVVSMPAPNEGAYADFTPSVRYIEGSPYDIIQINMTHKGGQELQDTTTNIYLDVNGTRYTLHMSS
ncbi:MAG: type IV pilin, partial [Methanomassiliicoccales archaeon]|nr:type IV pilin [Methanomassiliicoccales archaeon]